MTPENFKKGMLILRDTFPDRFAEMDKTTMQVWYQLLNDLDGKTWEKCILYIARNHEKPPVPATIRKIANEKRQALCGEEAWLQITNAVRNTGRYTMPQFDDPAVQSTVEALGWINICDISIDGLVGMRAHFYRTYEAMRKRHEMDYEMDLIEHLERKKLQ